jgi:hypothetical protein
LDPLVAAFATMLRASGEERPLAVAPSGPSALVQFLVSSPPFEELGVTDKEPQELLIVGNHPALGNW